MSEYSEYKNGLDIIEALTKRLDHITGFDAELETILNANQNQFNNNKVAEHNISIGMSPIIQFPSEDNIPHWISSTIATSSKFIDNVRSVQNNNYELEHLADSNITSSSNNTFSSLNQVDSITEFDNFIQYKPVFANFIPLSPHHSPLSHNTSYQTSSNTSYQISDNKSHQISQNFEYINPNSSISYNEHDQINNWSEPNETSFIETQMYSSVTNQNIKETSENPDYNINKFENINGDINLNDHKSSVLKKILQMSDDEYDVDEPEEHNDFENSELVTEEFVYYNKNVPLETSKIIKNTSVIENNLKTEVNMNFNSENSDIVPKAFVNFNQNVKSSPEPFGTNKIIETQKLNLEVNANLSSNNQLNEEIHIFNKQNHLKRFPINTDDFHKPFLDLEQELKNTLDKFSPNENNTTQDKDELVKDIDNSQIISNNIDSSDVINKTINIIESNETINRNLETSSKTNEFTIVNKTDSNIKTTNDFNSIERNVEKETVNDIINKVTDNTVTSNEIIQNHVETILDKSIQHKTNHTESNVQHKIEESNQIKNDFINSFSNENIPQEIFTKEIPNEIIVAVKQIKKLPIESKLPLRFKLSSICSDSSEYFTASECASPTSCMSPASFKSAIGGSTPCMSPLSCISPTSFQYSMGRDSPLISTPNTNIEIINKDVEKISNECLIVDHLNENLNQTKLIPIKFENIDRAIVPINKQEIYPEIHMESNSFTVIEEVQKRHHLKLSPLDGCTLLVDEFHIERPINPNDELEVNGKVPISNTSNEVTFTENRNSETFRIQPNSFSTINNLNSNTETSSQHNTMLTQSHINNLEKSYLNNIKSELPFHNQNILNQTTDVQQYKNIREVTQNESKILENIPHTGKFETHSFTTIEEVNNTQHLKLSPLEGCSLNTEVTATEYSPQDYLNLVKSRHLYEMDNLQREYLALEQPDTNSWSNKMFDDLSIHHGQNVQPNSFHTIEEIINTQHITFSPLHGCTLHTEITSKEYSPKDYQTLLQEHEINNEKHQLKSKLPIQLQNYKRTTKEHKINNQEHQLKSKLPILPSQIISNFLTTTKEYNQYNELKDQLESNIPTQTISDLLTNIKEHKEYNKLKHHVESKHPIQIISDFLTTKKQHEKYNQKKLYEQETLNQPILSSQLISDLFSLTKEHQKYNEETQFEHETFKKPTQSNIKINHDSNDQNNTNLRETTENYRKILGKIPTHHQTDSFSTVEEVSNRQHLKFSPLQGCSLDTDISSKEYLPDDYLALTQGH